MTLCPSIRPQMQKAWAALCQSAGPVRLPDGSFQDKQTGKRLICQMVAAATGVTINEILGKRRTARIASARQLAMFAMRRHCLNNSAPAIGRMFDRHHTTVLHAENVIPARLTTEPRLKRAYDRVWKELEALG